MTGPSMRPSPPERPLTGINVVSVEQAVAAPFATRQLADLGARVTKIERPGTGDFARDYDHVVNGLSSVFVWLNRGKESVCLDLKQDEARDILDDLLATADVFVHNLAPAAALRAGFDIPALHARFPRMIVCAISGYGSGGPMRDAKAYDLLVQGETGILSLTGDGASMAKVGISIADISAGMYAYSGVLAALVHRERTGEVRPVDVSLFDSLTEWLAYPLYYTRYGGRAPARMGTAHATIAPYGAFESSEGTALLIAVQNDHEWRRFCAQVLDDPGSAEDVRFATNSDRITHRAALDSVVAARFAALGTDEILELLRRADIAHSHINDISDLAEHPQLVNRRRWVETPTPSGPVRTLHPPALPDGARHDLGGVPGLGEHTAATLRRLGRGTEEIEQLRDQKVI